MTDRREPKEVRPAEILAAAQTNASIRGLSQKILQQTGPDGTPFAKGRLGFVVAFDTATWTCTALIGDQLTQVPGIPVLADVVPAVECAGQFLQIGDQYTLIGMLAKGPAAVRIRKTANQSIFNTGSATADNDLKFYGVAGRSFFGCGGRRRLCGGAVPGHHQNGCHVGTLHSWLDAEWAGHRDHYSSGGVLP
jgi:hypothetical protein